jgi:phosphopantetheine adenylyltransferase
VREIGQLGGSVHGLVPELVEERLRHKIQKNNHAKSHNRGK